MNGISCQYNVILFVQKISECGFGGYREIANDGQYDEFIDAETFRTF
jgi:hypothetical protein